MSYRYLAEARKPRPEARCYTFPSPILGACRSSFPMSQSEASTPRTRVVRETHRGVYDRETVYQILDEGFLCHVGFVADGHPFVIPTSYGRKDASLYIHGSAASRMLRQMEDRVPDSIAVPFVDAVVY